MDLSILDIYNIEAQRNGLIADFEELLVQLASQQQNLAVNQGVALEDNQRDFSRFMRDFGARFARGGLETSGIRDRLTDEALSDQQRTRDRLRDSFIRQNNQIDLSRQVEVGQFERGLATIAGVLPTAAPTVAGQVAPGAAAQAPTAQPVQGAGFARNGAPLALTNTATRGVGATARPARSEVAAGIRGIV